MRRAIVLAGLIGSLSVAGAQDFKIEDVSSARSVPVTQLKPGIIVFSDQEGGAAGDEAAKLVRFEDWARTRPAQRKFLGKSLDQIIGPHGLPPETVATILRQICLGLDAAHEQGVVHRDLKPQNIMVESQGRVAVMDFGLASTAEGGGLTRLGALLGTPDYMSPEQALGHKLDQRSDIFSLGIIAYEMLTGKAPFQSDDGDRFPRGAHPGTRPGATRDQCDSSGGNQQNRSSLPRYQSGRSVQQQSRKRWRIWNYTSARGARRSGLQPAASLAPPRERDRLWLPRDRTPARLRRRWSLLTCGPSPHPSPGSGSPPR